MDGGQPFQLGEWTIDPQRCVAHRQDEILHLEPKATEVLGYLASRPGEVVSRAELLEQLWPGVVVSDEVITNAVAKLRRAFGDDPRSPSLIETVPKRGYRLVAEVRHEAPTDTVADAPGSQAAKRNPTALVVILLVLVVAILATVILTRPTNTPAPESTRSFPLPDRPSITVLPFANLSEDEAQAYFVDGMTEDLITDLSRVSGLFVIARNSSFTYKNRPVDAQRVGRELGVRFIVEGSVRKVADRLRINVKLIDTRSGRHLWAERYDGGVADVFQFQERITRKVVDALSVQLTGSEKDYAAFQETHKTEAYEAFLQGWAAYRQDTPEAFEQAIAHLQRALDHDPAYGRALAAMAAIYWDTYQKRWYRRLNISPLSLVWQQAKEYLDRSMVAPTPLAHKIASAMLVTNRRYDEAMAEAKRAVAIDANDPLGHVALAEVLIYTGEPDKAEALIRKAMRLDPQAPRAYLLPLGKAQLMRGELTEAAASLEQAVAHNPDDRLAWMALIATYGLQGQQAKAKTAIARLQQLQQSDKLVSFTIANATEHWPFKQESDRNRFLEGLRKAGVPEW